MGTLLLEAEGMTGGCAMTTCAATEHGGGNAATRDQLILRYAPLVRRAVGGFAAGSAPLLEMEDIYSYGTMGLIDAIDRFDASRGVKFETYAMTRIRGYLVDQLRELDWLPRTARARVRSVQRASAAMEQRLGRSPDRQELAAEVGLGMVACERALADGGCQMLSLERLTHGGPEGEAPSLLDQLVDQQSPNPAKMTEAAELRHGVGAALTALPSRERQLLILRYGRNWTLCRVARQLGVSESRASQLHTQAIARMRRLLSAMFGELAPDALSA